MGQTRLEIIGHGTVGAQPAAVGDRGWLVFNGEIHNYLELAEELNQLGHPVDSRSDTAVLAAALLCWGPDAVHRLDGQWAFAYVDEVEGRAFLSRDPYGQKPLLYALSPGKLQFVSEAAALPAEHRNSVRKRALDAFAADGRYPSPRETFYERVYQVEPGATLTVPLGYPDRICHLPAPQSRHPIQRASAPAFGEAAVEFRARLASSLSLRLRADVPMGLLLSAGKDSASVLQLWREQCPGRVRALTYSNGGLDDEARDVRAWYREEVALTSTGPANGQFLRDRLPTLHHHLDAPLPSASLLALDTLFSRSNSLGVRCLVSCQGADELLAGYHYYSLLEGGLARRALNALHLYGATGLAARIADRRSAGKLLRRAGVIDAPRSQATTVDGLRAEEIYGPQFRTMLWYEDRIAMTHSVEVRYPFLNPSLVQWLLALPSAYFVYKWERKRLLHAAFAKTWPAPLRDERRKRGLPANELALLRQVPAFTLEGLRAAEAIAGYRTKEYQDVFCRKARVGNNTAMAIWRMSMIGHWLQGEGLSVAE